MDEIKYDYEKLDEETGKIKYCPMHDLDGKITGQLIYGLQAWFDENPEERKALGWIKHIHHPTTEVDYNRQTQYLVNVPNRVDQWTIEDNWKILDKSEEQMRLEELLNYNSNFDQTEGSIIFF